MTEAHQNSQKQATGLWIPFTIIFLGIIISMVFVVQTLKGYRKPRPLLIRPSSIDNAEQLTASLYKALYPLKLQGYGLILNSGNSSFARDLSASLASTFGKDTKNIKLNLKKIDLKQAYDNDKTDCLNTALFNMLRKPKRKWKKLIYFSVCTEADKVFTVFYSTDKSQIL